MNIRSPHPLSRPNHIYSKYFSLYLIALCLVTICSCTFLSCAQDEPTAPMINTPIGANQQVVPNETGVGALLNSTGQATGCSVAFIGSQYALTAARCVQNDPRLYAISIENPVSASTPMMTLLAITIHPLWNSLELNQSRAHLESLRQGQPGYYASNPSYDVAVLKLNAPKTDGIYFDPLRDSIPINALETLFYGNSTQGVSRSGSLLRITEQTPTTFTSLEYSLLASTVGGGAGLVSLDSGRTALVALASGGDGQGTMFTLVGAHAQFIGDVVNDAYSANVDLNRYRVIVNGPQQPGPVMPEEMNSFDCSMTSDGFCDRNCRRGEGDIDCDSVVMEETGSSFGAPCAMGSDCRSRLCLGITETRYVCSDFCNQNHPTPCPRGFSCIEDNVGDYVCGPTQATMNQGGGSGPAELRIFGANCNNDAQCTTGACISYQGERWCSERCTNDDQCPIRYICGAVTGGRACVPPQ